MMLASPDVEREYRQRTSVVALANALRRPTSDPAKLIRLADSALALAEAEALPTLHSVRSALGRPFPDREHLARACDGLLPALAGRARPGYSGR